MEKKKKQFIEMVHTIASVYVTRGFIDSKYLHVILGKAYKVKANDLLHQITFLSRKADQFVRYQGYIGDKPIWYSGPDVNPEN